MTCCLCKELIQERKGTTEFLLFSIFCLFVLFLSFNYLLTYQVVTFQLCAKTRLDMSCADCLWLNFTQDFSSLVWRTGPQGWNRERISKSHKPLKLRGFLYWVHLDNYATLFSLFVECSHFVLKTTMFIIIWFFKGQSAVLIFCQSKMLSL